MASPHPVVGETLGHFRIVQAIGAGGMGEVYRARDEQLHRDVALKVLPPASAEDATARARLLREARTASQLNHPNICTIHEVGETRGRAYIAMELVVGQPLSARVAAGPLPPQDVLRLGSQMADALAHAHAHGVVHRDLKSANVMLTPEGRVKVLDFGLAKRVSEEEVSEGSTQSLPVTQPGTVAGTLAYMAPEQLRGQTAEARSDVWALGVVLYEMATGRLPFGGHTAFEISSAILNESPVPLPSSVPAEVRAVIERCLEKEPGRRYQNGGEAGAALEAMQAGAVSLWATLRYRLFRVRWRAAVITAVVVLLLAALGMAYFRTRSGGAASRIHSLAVLPLENLSGDPQQQYFADGMTEELITNLAKVKALTVISPFSVMQYKGSKKPLAEIARELGVDGLIEGSVYKSGGRMKITAHLIDPATGRELWGDSYERELQDVLLLQAEVAQAVAHEIRVAVTPAETARLAHVRRVNPEAYELYLQGRSHWDKLTAPEQTIALQYFEMALQKDPDYALGYAGVGLVWAGRAQMGFVPPQEAQPRAKEAALKALALDDTLAEAHDLLATVLTWYEWDWPMAEKEFRRAIELNPNYANAHYFYSILLAALGRQQEAMAEMRRCLALDPHNRRFQSGFAWHLLNSGQYEEAIAQIQKSVQMDPSYPVPHDRLARALRRRGMYPEALEEARRMYAAREDREILVALQRHGYEAAKRLEADKLADRARRTYVAPTRIAARYAEAGATALALRWLERGFEVRDPQMVFLAWDASWDNLRTDPRFQALLRRMKLAP